MKKILAALFVSKESSVLTVLTMLLVGGIVVLAIKFAFATSPMQVFPEMWNAYVGVIEGMGFALSHNALVLVALFIGAAILDLGSMAIEWGNFLLNTSLSQSEDQMKKAFSFEAKRIQASKKVIGYTDAVLLISLFWYVRGLI